MGVGIGIVLLAVGLVLALAVGDSVGGMDLRLIGWILTAVGGLAIVVALIMTAQKSHQTIEVVDTGGPAPGSGGGTAGGTNPGAGNGARPRTGTHR